MASKLPTPLSSSPRISIDAFDERPPLLEISERNFLSPKLRNEISLKLDAEEQTLHERKKAIEFEAQQLKEKKVAWQVELDKEVEDKDKIRIFHDNLRALEIFRSKVPMAQNLSTEIILAAQIESSLRNVRDREAEALLVLAKRRQKKRQNYINLASLLIFFSLYSMMLLIQRDQFTAFSVETSVIFSRVMASLPTNGAGSSFFHGNVPGTTGMLSHNDEFYTWLNESLLAELYNDAKCGNGICESPEEVPGIGRFGCALDCGKVDSDRIVTLRIDLKTMVQQRYQSKPDLGALDPSFKYNIFSSHFNAYVFEEAMSPSANSVILLEVLRSDQLELRFFQTNAIADDVDINDVADMYHMAVDSIPEVSFNRTLDWQYGDVGEVLAVSYATATKVRDYCLNRVGDIYDARMTNSACRESTLPPPQGFPNYYAPLDSALQASSFVLASYGISGDISIPALNEYFREVSLSLLHPTNPFEGGAAIRYCNPLPKPRAVTTGVDFLEYFASGAAQCGPDLETPMRRRATGRGKQGRIRSSAAPGDIGSQVLAVEDAQNDYPERAPSSLPHTSLHMNPSEQSQQTLSEQRSSARLLKGANVGKLYDNPLGLRLVDVGIDDLGFWKCYSGSSEPSQNPVCWDPNAQRVFDSFNESNLYGYRNPTFVGVDIMYDRLDVFKNDTNLQAMVTSWRGNGIAAPGLKNAGLNLRFTVDGTHAHNAGPDCSVAWEAPSGVIALEYNFKTRVRLWNTYAGELRVWLCCNQCQDKTPQYVSWLNISDDLRSNGLSQLSPSPSLRLSFQLTGQMNAAGITTLQERICRVIWTSIDERCSSRVWSSVEKGRNSAFELSFTFIAPSNSRIARIGYLAVFEMKKLEIKTQFPLINLTEGNIQSQVNAPGPIPKVRRDRLVGCVSHYDCVDGQFCSTGALQTLSQGFLGGGGPGPSNTGCDLCKYCISDSRDPNDRFCPRDKCGSLAGSYPDCIDASILFSNFSCPSSFTLNMSRVPPAKKPLTIPDIVPLQSPNSTARKGKFLTPYNQMVGALIITQKRISRDCLIRSDSIGKYVSIKVPALGPVCRGDKILTSPFGVDPTFTPTSDLYKGDVDQTEHYSSSEENNFGTPFGFFSHSYDGKKRGKKQERIIMEGEASNFKLYFTERVSSAQAQNLLTYMRDGGFLDSQTKEVTVEVPTLNYNTKIFSLFTFTFSWQDAGKVVWDYQIASVSAYPYPGDFTIGRQMLEILYFVKAIEGFRMMKYFGLWNFVDLSHFAVMWIGWYLWLKQLLLSWNLDMPPGFAVLNSFVEDTQARLFLTNPENEHELLTFVKKLRDMVENQRTYSIVSSIAVILFVLRCLKVADFQPRIALVTRTLAVCMSDIVHFAILFFGITLGYSIAGELLFGHQNEGFSTFENSLIYMVVFLISWDPYQWMPLSHAAPSWIFNIYLWSWIFLSCFILLNIFLAILVDGFMSMRKIAEEEQLSGLFWDMADILTHETLKALNFLWPNKFPYLSDEYIISILSTRFKGSTSRKHIKEVQEHFHNISLSGSTEIRCDYNVAITTTRLLGLLEDYFPGTTPQAFNPTMSPETAALLDPRIKSIMSRYGMNVGPPDAESKREKQRKDFLAVAELDTMRKLGEIHMLQCGYQYGSNDGETVFSSVTINVTIERARNIPKMDLLRGADVFCVVFLDGSPDLFQTEIRSGVSEADWCWDPELSRDFRWTMAENSELLKDDKRIVVMMYDKDQISEDDLIGCVIVQLGELVNGQFDAWKQVIRPPNAPKRQYLLFTPPKPELKLKVTLSSGTIEYQQQVPNDINSFLSEQMMVKKQLSVQSTALALRGELCFPIFPGAPEYLVH